jgi:hypothetical protein
VSRTDAHVPLRVRIARGDIGRAEVHDHTHGACDLPDPFHPDAMQPQVFGCHWVFVWTGTPVCSCWMCHGGDELRRERRNERHRIRRELRAERDRWNE